MKKVLITLFCLLSLQIGCFSANWYKINNKMSVDFESIKVSQNKQSIYITGWFKMPNGKDKGISYELYKVTIDLNNNGKYRLDRYIAYDKKGNVIADLENENSKFYEYAPDSLGDNFYLILSKLGMAKLEVKNKNR